MMPDRLAPTLSDDLLSDNSEPARSLPLNGPAPSGDADDRGRAVHQGRDRAAVSSRPGTRLPEVALAAELETSRGTVREALRTLADGGLIQIIPRRGVFVSQLSVRATWEITSLRALLEPYASRLALEAQRRRSAPCKARSVAAFEALQGRRPHGRPGGRRGRRRRVPPRGVPALRPRDAAEPAGDAPGLSRRIVLTNQISSADAPTLDRAARADRRGGRAARSRSSSRRRSATHVIEAGELLDDADGAARAGSRAAPDATTRSASGAGRRGASPHPRRADRPDPGRDLTDGRRRGGPTARPASGRAPCGSNPSRRRSSSASRRRNMTSSRTDDRTLALAAAFVSSSPRAAQARPASAPRRHGRRQRRPRREPGLPARRGATPAATEPLTLNIWGGYPEIDAVYKKAGEAFTATAPERRLHGLQHRPPRLRAEADDGPAVQHGR